MYDIKKLLHMVAEGSVSPEEAALKLKISPYEELGFAMPDHHRNGILHSFRR